MADAESVKKALEALRDAADDQSRAENPDLKPVAEAFNGFHEQWATKSEADAKAEQDPDSVATEEPADTAPEVVPEVPKPAARTAKKADEPVK